MKILAINAFHYRRGGSETVYFNTTALLRAHGHEVVEFALKWPENIPCPTDTYFAESKETRRGSLRQIGNIVNYFYHFEAARKLDRLIRTYRPDIAQIHLIWGQLTPSVLRVLRRHHIPVVLTAHDYRLVCPASVMRNGRGEVCEQCEGRNFTHCVANNCCKGSKTLSVMMAAEQYTRNLFFHPPTLIDGMLYVSDFARRKHEQYMPELKDIPWARIYNSSSHISQAPAPPASEPYFLYFGRLSHEKGIRTLVKAFAILPHMTLRVAGSGSEADIIAKLIERRGLTNIHLLGYKTGSELRDLVAGARFVIVPSEWYENNPLTIIEAYSYGTPVIGASIGGIPEIVVDGVTGFTFPSGDTVALTSVIRRAEAMSENDYVAMQQAALTFARNNFNPEDYYPRLMELYRRVAPDKF